MKVLAIETSCDDTSIAILDNEQVISLVTHSQIETHNKFGGVIPEIASRLHMENIHSLIKRAFNDSGLTFKDIDAIAVTVGPGLVNTLQIGILVAKTLSLSLNIPLFEINHMTAHMFSPFIGKSKESIPAKAIFLIVSGGHTIIGVKKNNNIEIYGETRDDAIGEAYDKVAKMLSLDYPGGPIIDKMFYQLKEENFKTFVKAPVPNIKNYDFSYSGLKSWVNKNKDNYSKEEIIYLFQKSAIQQLVNKVEKLSNEIGIDTIIIGGGVSANKYLRETISKKDFKKVYFPKIMYSGDNAAMIGYCYYIFKDQLKAASYDLDAKPKLKLGEKK